MKKTLFYILLLILINVAFSLWLLPYEQKMANGHIEPSLSAILLCFIGIILVLFGVIKYWQRPYILTIIFFYAICFLFWAYKFQNLECNIIDG